MNDLNQRLATLADEMTDTDYTTLRQRVDTTARRLGYRRAAVTSVAALALAGAAAIGGVQMLPQANETPQPGESASVVAPPTPSPSTPPAPPVVSPPANPTSSPPASSATPPDHVPGRLVYLRVGGEIEMVTVTNGVTKTTSFGGWWRGDQAITVSPDGTMVALVQAMDNRSEYPGDLLIVRPGGSRKLVAQSVMWGGGVAPVWTPDSKHLLVGITELQGDTAVGEKYGYVDAATGTFTETDLDQFPEYLTWSANGSFRAHAEGSSTIVVERANGTVLRRFSLTPQPECATRECPFAVQAVSDDGRYIATAIGNTDPTRVTGAQIVLDTTNGRRVPIPASVKGITEIFFRSDNSLVVQTKDKLHLVNRSGKITATIDRPDPTNEADLGRYTDR
ncbi:hypothetical protein GCM10022251_19500 [Phytohabitans flavus]|uniref:Uncharacterized protein n=1 Tax=Phytohabitans flavus TaxID=1076124 RepID=A0A6F8XZ50_9ACTN|nr:hypothetical protein [Phytohabitans flavus]BCB79126.1 hypothetical protein Pflav_055360 [Phytohabitans flavus]